MLQKLFFFQNIIQSYQKKYQKNLIARKLFSIILMLIITFVALIRNPYFTNVYINIVKLLKLIDLNPNCEITIGISQDELYNYKTPNALDRFVNVYYWIADLVKLKNINLINIKNKRDDLDEDHLPINNWFLRLVDLDKKVLVYNFS